MPTLDWIGKKAVVEHHKQVPFHLLKANEELSVGDPDFEDSQAVFITPKPTKLLRRILEIAADKDSIILDSFAGSGTTGYAVLALNKEDGGNRRFAGSEILGQKHRAAGEAFFLAPDHDGQVLSRFCVPAERRALPRRGVQRGEYLDK
jgi:hypothetical protein